MKVGLVRHFQVKKDFPKETLITPDQFNQWLNEYDESEIEDAEMDLCGIEWNICLASDLFRAAKTAEKIFSGNIILRND